MNVVNYGADDNYGYDKSGVVAIEMLPLVDGRAQLNGLDAMAVHIGGERKAGSDTEGEGKNGSKNQGATPAASVGAWISGEDHAVSQFAPLADTIIHDRKPESPLFSLIPRVVNGCPRDGCCRYARTGADAGHAVVGFFGEVP